MFCPDLRNSFVLTRKCEADFVYPIEGCGKTLSEINGTIPHTRIDMKYRGAITPTACIYTRMSVVRQSYALKKTTTFSIADLRKTLSQYVVKSGKISELTLQI